MRNIRSIMMSGIIDTVEPGSLADRLGLCPGDVLLAINGHSLRDVLDVQYYAADESLDLRVRRSGGERTYHVEREYGVPLGLGFTTPTFDGMRRCQNRCEFCFVSQMPPHAANQKGLSGARSLRRSLYVRDDDYRYSVLYGSFITLTELAPEDWERLEEQRLSPLYVSVHATEGALRRQLLGRADAPDILSQIDRLLDLGIDVHAQIVLIPGVNDGLHLERSLADLSARYPGVRSIGVVPVGLTRYHRGGCRLYIAQETRAIVEQIAPMQAACRAQYGASVVYLADEWYLQSGLEVPPDKEYDDYPQIENGIGLVRQFLEDAYGLQVSSSRLGTRSCTLVCGTSIAPIMRRVAGDLAEKSGCRIEVIPVVNWLFGETVTVSGLLGGEDVLRALAGRGALGEIVFLPRAMFAQLPDQGEGREKQQALLTLDDLTPREFEDRLGRPVELVGYMSEVCERLRGCP
jgi:putative radical SAM enzyme (TIGR03279 family)